MMCNTRDKIIERTIRVSSLDQTARLASCLAENVKGGEVICLIGVLGAGKTYFVKYFAEALGVNRREVTSPTFVYLRKYEGARFVINHFDFYRIENTGKTEGIGLEDALGQENAIAVIEWADKVMSALPEDRLEIFFEYLGQTKRQFILKASKKYSYLLKNIDIIS